LQTTSSQTKNGKTHIHHRNEAETRWLNNKIIHATKKCFVFLLVAFFVKGLGLLYFNHGKKVFIPS